MIKVSTTGMVVSLKTDLRFPIPGQQGHGGRIIHYGYENEYKSFEEFEKSVKEYIDYYNNDRIQSKTKWMPPVKYKEASMC